MIVYKGAEAAYDSYCDLKKGRQIMRRESTILVVDDEDIIRNILVKLLHTTGYNVLQASNSTQAMTMIRQHNPDLMLLDMIMPGVDSLEVLKTIRGDDRWQDIPVILISAIDDLELVTTYIEAGIDDFLPKPFNNALLNLKISNALENRNSQLELRYARLSSEEFCRQLAHDLNNGLTGILMTAELLLMEQGSGESKDYLHEIIAATEQVSALITERRQLMMES